MKAPLMKSTSGIRGIVGLSLDPFVVIRYAAAFGRFVNGGRVVVGRDSRPSGTGFSQLVISTLAMTGCEVIDLGIVPTPTVELAVAYHKAAGGIAITASHNPSEWNALKFFNSLGEFITKKQYERLEKTVSAESWKFAAYSDIGKVTTDATVIDRHIADILRLDFIPKAEIKKAHFRVVVDAINGAGSRALPELLERLGVTVIRLNCKGDGDFYRKPEPIAENLADLGKAVVANCADLGLACDPDADRLALVDETGRPIGEELTLTLATAYYLTRKRGPVAINLSTSSTTADVARMAGSPVFYSPVGEANVIAEMRRRKAVIGGEGNGGVILPQCHFGRDALVGAALIMSYLARTKKNLSTMAGTIPAYVNIKKKAPLPKDYERKVCGLEKAIKSAFGDILVDRRDGLRFDLDGGWIQIRKSNTEPIYRLIAEARTDRLARQLVKLVSGILK